MPHESSGSGFPSIPVDLISSSSSTSWKDSGPSHLREEEKGVMTSGYVLMYVYKCEYKFNKSKHIHVHMRMHIHIKYIEIYVHRAIYIYSANQSDISKNV